jgi:hypothetical protein
MVEFKKCGLLHGHIIFWVSTDTSEPTLELIDSFTSAEIPNPATGPLGYAMVAEHMVHGPCGKYNPNSPCMKNGKLKKTTQKEFHAATTVDENGFVVYKHPNNQRFVVKSGVSLGNHWIVPHNLELLKNMMHTLILNGATKVYLLNTVSSMLQKDLTLVKHIFKK